MKAAGIGFAHFALNMAFILLVTCLWLRDITSPADQSVPFQNSCLSVLSERDSVYHFIGLKEFFQRWFESTLSVKQCYACAQC